MDENFLENAEAMEEAERANSIDISSRAALPSVLLEPSQYKRLECEDCDNGLPEFRKQRGCLRCVFCQTFFEKTGNKVRDGYFRVVAD